MTLSVRAAAPADVPLIYRFICDLADYEKLRDAVRADEAMLEQHLFGPTARAEVLIGEIGGQPRGFALFFHNFSTFEGAPGLYLEDLFVEQEARGSGLGKALLARLAAIATTRGCARMEWAVLDWNAPSIAFYRSLGARAMDDWTVYRLDGDALERLAA